MSSIGYYQPKTDRKYGRIFGIIRRRAAKGTTFKITDFRGITRRQAQSNCWALVLTGELEIVRMGKPGRFGGVTRAVYRRSEPKFGLPLARPRSASAS